MLKVRVLVLFVFEWILCNVCDGFLGPNVLTRCTDSRMSKSRRKFTLGSNKEGTTTSQYTGGEEVTLSFRPSGVQVSCKPGEVLLDVAQRCSGMIEDSTRPFCQNGGCYNCEVEILEASELGLEDNVVRACLFEVPEGVNELTFVQMTSEEAYGDIL